MVDIIKNTEYITVSKGGIFVGETPATHYRGVKIGAPDIINAHFQTI